MVYKLLRMCFSAILAFIISVGMSFNDDTLYLIFVHNSYWIQIGVLQERVDSCNLLAQMYLSVHRALRLTFISHPLFNNATR